MISNMSVIIWQWLHDGTSIMLFIVISFEIAFISKEQDQRYYQVPGVNYITIWNQAHLSQIILRHIF